MRSDELVLCAVCVAAGVRAPSLVAPGIAACSRCRREAERKGIGASFRDGRKAR